MMEGIGSWLAVVQVCRAGSIRCRLWRFAGGESAFFDESIVGAAGQGEVVDVGAAGLSPSVSQCLVSGLIGLGHLLSQVSQAWSAGTSKCPMCPNALSGCKNVCPKCPKHTQTKIPESVLTCTWDTWDRSPHTSGSVPNHSARRQLSRAANIYAVRDAPQAVGLRDFLNIAQVCASFDGCPISDDGQRARVHIEREFLVSLL